MRIKAKLILIFSLIAIVPICGLVLTLIQENKKELYNQISEKQLLICDREGQSNQTSVS